MLSKSLLLGLWASQFLGMACGAPVEDAEEVQHALNAPVDTADGVIDSLQDSKLIPDVLDPFDVLFLLNATWRFPSHSAVTADYGNTIRPSLLRHMPHSLLLTYPWGESTAADERESNLVIALTDADAPTPRNPKNSNFLHWLQYDHRKHKSGKIQTESLAPYLPPSPPKGSDKHRYLLVIMVPKSGTRKKLHLKKPASRASWGYKHRGKGLREYMEDNGLVPIAANYFRAQWEKPKHRDSVDEDFVGEVPS